MKTQPLRIACADVSDFERRCLVEFLTRNNRAYRVENIGYSSYAFCKHASEKFDVIFLGAMAGNAPDMELARSLRTVSDEALIVLLTKEASQAHEAAGLADTGVDEVIVYNGLGIVTREKVKTLLATAEGHRTTRRVLLSQDALRAARAPAAILDQDGFVLFANWRAEKLFHEGDPFRLLETGELVCSAPAATKRFHEGIRQSSHIRYPLQRNAFIEAAREGGRMPVIAMSIPKKCLHSGAYTYYVVFIDMETQYNAALNFFPGASEMLEGRGGGLAG